MTAQAKIDNVHRRLSSARKKFHATELKKSGRNTFANYSYFELGDFLVPALAIFDEIGLGATVSFTADLATMRIVNLDNPEDCMELTSPMGGAALKGCHEVQNIGAVETYQRRYLWTAALEIVEHDALDAGGGTDTRKDSPKNAITDAEWAKIAQLVEVTNANVPMMLKAIGSPATALDGLTRAEYDAAVVKLEEKLARQAKDATNDKAKVAA